MQSIATVRRDVRDATKQCLNNIDLSPSTRTSLAVFNAVTACTPSQRTDYRYTTNVVVKSGAVQATMAEASSIQSAHTNESEKGEQHTQLAVLAHMQLLCQMRAPPCKCCVIPQEQHTTKHNKITLTSEAKRVFLREMCSQSTCNGGVRLRQSKLLVFSPNETLRAAAQQNTQAEYFSHTIVGNFCSTVSNKAVLPY
jgi:hypothetical protein